MGDERMGKHLARGHRALAIAVTGALLAACAGPPPPTIRARTSSTTTNSTTASSTTASSTTANSTPPTTSTAPALAAMPKPAPAAPARRGKGPKPDAIVDQTGRAVRALLGVPDLQRREPPAEVWQYTGEDCVLDITFYPAKDGSPARAAYLESRSIDGARLAPAVCLGSLGELADD